MHRAGYKTGEGINQRDGIKVTLPDIEYYRKAQDFLQTAKIQYHTYKLATEKTLKVVMRNIPVEYSEEEIARELSDLGYPIQKVQRMKKGSNRQPMPLVLLDLEKTDKAKEVYNLVNFLNLRIKLEPQNRKASAGQCHQCQGFGHSQMNCHADPRCVRCGEGHLTKTCTHTRQMGPATCANCGGPHPANFRGCTYRPGNTRSAPNHYPQPQPRAPLLPTPNAWAQPNQSTHKQAPTGLKKTTSQPALKVTGKSHPHYPSTTTIHQEQSQAQHLLELSQAMKALMDQVHAALATYPRTHHGR
jgi:hypothetical protein